MKHNHPNHRPHRPRHPPPLHGLNSVFSEALTEHRFDSTEELRNLVARRQPRLTSLLESILNEGINDPYVAAELLQIEEAIGTLRAVRELILLSGTRKAAAILPLPPHIWHRLTRALHSDLIFSSEEHLPPHFGSVDYDHIETLMPRDLGERVSDLEGIVIEACFENGVLLVRRSAARFVQMIAGTNEKVRLFVHVIPHRPHHAEFCPLDPESTVVLI